MATSRTTRIRDCSRIAALLALLLAGPTAARAGHYNFVTVDAGPSYQTLLYGVSNDGVVTGIALDPANHYYGTGFVLKGGVRTLVTAPGAVNTEFYQVNTAGQVAASYYGPDGNYHAAVYDSVHATWTNLPDVSGYQENLAGGINDHGVVVGDPFLNSSYVGGVGWTWNGTGYSFFSAPGADPTKLGTATYNINDAGQVVGYYQDSSGITHGFLKTGTGFATLDAPGAVGTTSTQGINNRGDATGYFTDASGTDHGYLWSGGLFTTRRSTIEGTWSGGIRAPKGPTTASKRSPSPNPPRSPC